MILIALSADFTSFKLDFLLECQYLKLYTCIWLAAPFNNMRTLTFKAQPTNTFFASVNQMFGGSSQLPTMVSEP